MSKKLMRVKQSPIPKQKTPPKKVVKSTEHTIQLVLPADEWVFFQNSALSSVPVDQDGHTIVSPFDKHINDNGNTWTNEHLEQYYHTYVGGHVFQDHNQIENKSFGFIADAKLRKIEEYGGYRYVIDTLMAINIKRNPNPQLVEKIVKNGEFQTSMGCLSSGLMCSLCGNVDDEENEECHHIFFDCGKKYTTQFGYNSTIANIAVPFNNNKKINKYDEEDYDSYPITFIENSILTEEPAYKGVVTSFLFKIDPNHIVDNQIILVVPERAYKRSTYGAIRYWENKQALKVKS